MPDCTTLPDDGERLVVACNGRDHLAAALATVLHGERRTQDGYALLPGLVVYRDAAPLVIRALIQRADNRIALRMHLCRTSDETILIGDRFIYPDTAINEIAQDAADRFWARALPFMSDLQKRGNQ
jgi:hypothetical protein